MSKIIQGETYYSIPEVAKKLNISRVTILKWAISGQTSKGNKIKVLRDTFRNNYYIAEHSVVILLKQYNPEKRFEQVATDI